MAFPAVQQVIESSTPTAGMSHVINLPVAVAGKLLLIILDKGSTAATINAHSELTELLDENLANGLYIAYRMMNGHEPSTYTLTSSANTRTATHAYRLTGAAADPAPEIGTTSSGTSATPAPPASATPGSAKDYLFIAFYGAAGEEADDDTWSDTPPTNYTPSPPRMKACGIAGSNLGGLIAAAERQLNTGVAETPGTFAKDVSAAWRAQTIMVHPAPDSFVTMDGVLYSEVSHLDWPVAVDGVSLEHGPDVVPVSPIFGGAVLMGHVNYDPRRAVLMPMVVRGGATLSRGAEAHVFEEVVPWSHEDPILDMIEAISEVTEVLGAASAYGAAYWAMLTSMVAGGRATPYGLAEQSLRTQSVAGGRAAPYAVAEQSLRTQNVANARSAFYGLATQVARTSNVLGGIVKDFGLVTQAVASSVVTGGQVLANAMGAAIGTWAVQTQAVHNAIVRDVGIATQSLRTSVVQGGRSAQTALASWSLRTQNVVQSVVRDFGVADWRGIGSTAVSGVVSGATRVFGEARWAVRGIIAAIGHAMPSRSAHETPKRSGHGTPKR